MKSKTPKSAQKSIGEKITLARFQTVTGADWKRSQTCCCMYVIFWWCTHISSVVWCWCIQFCLCERWSQYIEKSRLASFQRDCIQSTTHHLLEPRTDNIHFPTIIIIIISSNIISYNLHNRPSTGEKWWVDTSALSGLFDEKVFFIEASAFFHQYYPSFYS